MKHKKFKKRIIHNKKKTIKVVPRIKRKYKKRNPKVVEVIKIVEPIAVLKTAPNKMYFTQNTENSIIEYNKEVDSNKRNDIYNVNIKFPFEKLVENIFNTFKFTYFEVGPLEIQKETIAHLVSNIDKYDPTKGKAFAYFSIVAKHYLIALNNSTYKRFNQHVDINDEKDENTVQLQSEDKYYKNKEMDEFIKKMIGFWETNVNKIFTKSRDLNIANAVIELFRQSGVIEAFNKKALYLYIREISNCKTQQITKVINRMKQYQVNLSKSYRDNGDILVGSYVKMVK